MHKKDDIVKIYDDMFNLIGAEKWSVVHEKGLLHQVVHLWIYGDDAEGRWLYFIQRSKDREDFPGLLDLPVSGHIDPEETFSHTIVTLTQECLGLKLLPEHLEHAGNIHRIIDTDTFHDNAFCQVYMKKSSSLFLNLMFTARKCFLKLSMMTSATGSRTLREAFPSLHRRVSLSPNPMPGTGGGSERRNLIPS